MSTGIGGMPGAINSAISSSGAISNTDLPMNGFNMGGNGPNTATSNQNAGGQGLQTMSSI